MGWCRQVPLLNVSALNLIRAFWVSELFRSGELRRGVWLRGWVPVDIVVVDMSPCPKWHTGQLVLGPRIPSPLPCTKSHLRTCFCSGPLMWISRYQRCGFHSSFLQRKVSCQVLWAQTHLRRTWRGGPPCSATRSPRAAGPLTHTQAFPPPPALCTGGRPEWAART